MKTKAMELHKQWQGKIEVVPRAPLHTKEDLALAYTPGVAEPCLAILKDPDLSYSLTRRGHLVAVVTDGSAVLGLGNIGGLAGMPVMEGKCALFKAFGNVDAIPLCLDTQDTDEFVKTVAHIAPSFGGINLEDIAAPRCFEIEEKLKRLVDIPVFHDDQHGTAVVVAAALMNALVLVGKTMGDAKVVINGAGSAGIAIGKHLWNMGVRHLVMVDKCGILEPSCPGMNPAQAKMADLTQPTVKGTLQDALVGADVFVGVSAPGVLTPQMIQTMEKDPIVFAMANPMPEILPSLAKEAGAKVVGTGRSDYPNQINNVLAFPGIFRGALDARASSINEEMKVAASRAIAALVGDDLSPDYIIPSPLDTRVAEAVRLAIIRTAYETGVARLPKE